MTTAESGWKFPDRLINTGLCRVFDENDRGRLKLGVKLLLFFRNGYSWDDYGECEAS